MPEANTPMLVHIGSIRDESLHILRTAVLPTFIATLEHVSGKVESLKDNVPNLFLAEHPITPQGDDAVLYEYSLSEFNSLAPISGLKKLYPGLVEKQHRTVETHTLEAALKAHELNATAITHLIIEQPESTQVLLQALEAQGHLHSLINLWVRTSPESLYNGMPTQPELLATCEQLGFEIVNTQADDPDFVLVELKRNPLCREYKKLQEKAVKLGRREKEQIDANEKAQAEIAKLKQALEKAQHDAVEHQKQNEQLKQVNKKLTQHHDEQKQALEKAQHDVVERQKKNEQLKKIQDENIVIKEEAQAEIAQLEQANEKLIHQHAEQKQALEKAQHDVVERQKQNEQLKKAQDENAVVKEKAEAEINQLKQEREKLTKQQVALREQLGEQRQSNQVLEAELQATQTRQNKLAIELERAEAQLDLIKDLLLKDKLLQR